MLVIGSRWWKFCQLCWMFENVLNKMLGENPEKVLIYGKRRKRQGE